MRSLGSRPTSRRDDPAASVVFRQAEQRPVQPLRPRIDLPVRDPAPAYESAERHRARGRFLARQDAWDDLGREICEADAEGRLTEGLRPVASLLAEGARADAVEAATVSVMKGEPRNARAIVAALEVNLEDMPKCPAMAYVVSMAHIDIAHAWAGASRLDDLSPQRRKAFVTHMTVAAQLVDRFDPFEMESALWAEVRCNVLDIDPEPSQRVADDYEDLIDLQPGCPDHMRAFGRDLLSRRYGNREKLDREARRTALRTSDHWGVGGYAWVYIGALERDSAAIRGLDIELFIEGLYDILHRFPGQDMANRLAAFTGLTVPASAAKGSKQARLSDCFNWIVQDHLHEMHPMVWALAPAPQRHEKVETEEADLAKRGRVRAITTIADHFAPLLGSGRRMVFTPKGLEMPRMD